jgi:chitinase
MSRILALAALLGTLGMASSATAAERRLLAYYASRSGEGVPTYNATTIPYAQLTHIDHAFLRLAPAGDGSLAIGPNLLEPELIQRAHAAGVKVMISVGGGGARGFGPVATDPAKRANLVKNLHKFVVENGYDGVDMDWEFPQGLEERAACTLLMLAIRKELPPPFLVSMATPADPTRQGSYDVIALAQILDFFNVMTYDFHGPWSNHAGHHSPLFLDPQDPAHTHASLRDSIDIYLDYFHVPPEKLNIGTGFYGYEFTTAGDLWDKCDCRGTTNSRSYGTYIKPRINQMGWVRRFDEAAQAPYLVHESRSEPGFITYDDPESTARKVEYVLGQRGLGGFFTWAIGGRFNDYDGQSQDLLDAMAKAFEKYRLVSEPNAGGAK